MGILTDIVKQQLLNNGRQQETLKGTSREKDFFPVVKLTLPFTNATWLLTELDPKHQDIAFGLCDLGMGYPELGSVSLTELSSIDFHGVKVMPDDSFKADKPLSQYAALSHQHGQIVSEPEGLTR